MENEFIEKPSKGTKGYFLWDPFGKKYFFRIYHAEGNFVDYDIHCEEVCVEIASGDLSFYEGKNKNFLDWSKTK